MKRISIIVLLFTVVMLAACSSEPVEVTRVVSEVSEIEVTRIVETEVRVEVTRLVETEVEVEVTRLVEIPLEVTRIVSDDGDGLETASNLTNPDGMLNIGDEGKDGEQRYLVKEWREADSITSKRDGEVYPTEGGKFILAKFDVYNDGFDADDIYCNFDMGETLIDDLGREFDQAGRAGIIDPYEIKGNLGCRDDLPPGFGHKDQILAFMIPIDATPVYLKLWDPNELPDRSDPLGRNSSVTYLLEPDDISTSATEVSEEQEASQLDLDSFTDTWAYESESINMEWKFLDDGTFRLQSEIFFSVSDDSEPEKLASTDIGSWEHQGGNTICLTFLDPVKIACSEWVIEGDSLTRSTEDGKGQTFARQ